MEMKSFMNLRVAPPDKASEMLKSMGYEYVNAKMLRSWYKTGVIPGVNTGHKVLLPIARIVDVLENGIPQE